LLLHVDRLLERLKKDNPWHKCKNLICRLLCVFLVVPFRIPKCSVSDKSTRIHPRLVVDLFEPGVVFQYSCCESVVCLLW